MQLQRFTSTDTNVKFTRKIATKIAKTDERTHRNTTILYNNKICFETYRSEMSVRYDDYMYVGC